MRPNGFVRHAAHGALLLAAACASAPPSPATTSSSNAPARSGSPSTSASAEANANATTGDANANATTGEANATTGDANANATTGDANANATTGDANANATTGDAWWAFLGTPRPQDGALAVQQLSARLRQLPPGQVLQIHRAFFHELMRSYRWDLWGAAYLVNGGCSDDCFDYFRGWLLLQGKGTFDAALRSPDDLADLTRLSHLPDLEEALSLTTDAYRAMTSQEPQTDALLPPLGQGWDFDDPAEMKKRYPKLSARFSTP